MPRGVPKASNPELYGDKPAEPEGEICRECWPGGWPEDTTAAMCSHGQWSRAVGRTSATVEVDE